MHAALRAILYAAVDKHPPMDDSKSAKAMVPLAKRPHPPFITEEHPAKHQKSAAFSLPMPSTYTTYALCLLLTFNLVLKMMVARGGKKAPDGHNGQDHSQQRAVKTKGKNTVPAVTEPSDTSLRRSSRGTRGQGGALAQLKAIKEVVKLLYYKYFGARQSMLYKETDNKGTYGGGITGSEDRRQRRRNGDVCAYARDMTEVQTRPVLPAKRTAAQVTRNKQTLNPMAPPVKPKRGRKTTSTQKHPTQELLASPTTEVESRFQEADPGSHFGFRLPEPSSSCPLTDTQNDMRCLLRMVFNMFSDNYTEHYPPRLAVQTNTNG
ncbi:hypothetical protein BV22DRAFT_1052565 [Leucogyrophana mollusca]|uniref:Uncharacterized protein n=1 Tax=Leucogyrophana mollusca TaxID=85980 RepID=A0ACB8AVK4_9AGAM|nr:hypothetical protein BV22DRAFT_1052565 [Leucogyrophana mollusca]